MQKLFKYILVVLIVGSSYTGWSQRVAAKGGSAIAATAQGNRIQLQWEAIRKEQVSEDQTEEFLFFQGGAYMNPELNIPSYSVNKRLSYGVKDASVQIVRPKYVVCTNEEKRILSQLKGGVIKDLIEPEVHVSTYRKMPYAQITFLPIRKNATTGQFEKLVSFELQVTSGASTGIASNRGEVAYKIAASNSVLRSGASWYKIGVTEDGIYQLSYAFLKSIGWDMNTINPQNIRVFGNGGGMLPYNNSKFRHDDLVENAVYVEGGEDGVFDGGDYIAFYGQSQHRWDRGGSSFIHRINRFSDTTFYFISADFAEGTPKRIEQVPSLGGTPDAVVTTFDDYVFYDKEERNLIKSGIEWYGEQFGIVPSYDFVFTFPNIDLTSPVWVKSDFAARTIGGTSTFSLNVVNQPNAEISCNIGPVFDDYSAQYAGLCSSDTEFIPSGPNMNVVVTFDRGNATATGWLNYIEMNARRKLTMVGDQMLFRDNESIGVGKTARFNLTGVTSDFSIWDVTNPVNVFKLAVSSTGNTLQFTVATDSLREFAAFNGNTFLTPTKSGPVENQNLHTLPNTQLIVVTHKDFEEEALELAAWHAELDGLSSVVVTTEQIYNEFGSGSQDITAIKDFVRMFYDRAGIDTNDLPKYLLLFGDGSYDFKDRITGNTNFIPSFQSANSVSPTQSYITDDYFGLLDEDEGSSVFDVIDIGIGRLPVKNKTEARNAINKIKAYSSRNSMGAWRNNVIAVADDEDNSIHMRDADDIAEVVDTSYGEYNIDKIFLDAYRQRSGPGGERYPDVNEELGRRMDFGGLIIYYIGHGGELGWAHERILEVGAINSWTNINNMPLFVTATCEFSRFDDPKRTSAGEYVFLNPNGGGIALLTTTRLVYSTPNKELAVAFFKNAFVEVNGEMPRLGDITRLTKVNGPPNINSRNFTLLGDPALRLAYPKHNVVTTILPDTIRALGRVRVGGYLEDEEGNKLTSFNGVIYPLIFDKSQTIETLNNDGLGAYIFQVRKNILFKGKASVKNGEFEFDFVVPKDIAYNLGEGRISYYAENGEEDANGYSEDFIIGGIDANVAADNDGPAVDLYMNDSTFAFGGITDEEPDLFAQLFDENGINTVGNGVGHDLVAVLDENTTNSIVLNDYYESDLDSYKSGVIRYPLSELSEGKHSLRIKVWDVYNNSGEAYTEFVVTSSAKLALDHVLNYPNPFTTNTQFYFGHNQPGQSLDVRIQVFTIAGNLVKTIDSFVSTDGYLAGPIAWNGRDEYGDKIGRGVYVYKVSVVAPTGEKVDKFEKLVILN